MTMLSVPIEESDHIHGDANAGVTLVEYGDYECEYCGLAYPIIKRVQAHFGKRLRFVFRNFPLTEIHPLAEEAAEIAEFAGAHGKFWEMHDQLYANQSALGMPLYLAIAGSLDLPEQGLRAALADEFFAPKIKDDFLGGVRSGVNGTPAFYINQRRHDASFDYEVLCSAIDTQLGVER